MAITKNKQSNEKILEMTKAAFPSKTVSSITELTEGMCNIMIPLISYVRVIIFYGKITR